MHSRFSPSNLNTVRSSCALFFATLLFAHFPTLAWSDLAPQGKKWSEDHDGDGKADHFFEDLDGDGNIDICEIDLDEDGNKEERWVDDDDDGDWDTRQLNPNDDGKWDSGKSDKDGDGKFEWEWTDTDGDGKIDFDEIRPIDPEPIPNGPTPNNPPPAPGSSLCYADDCDEPYQPVGLGGYEPFAIYNFVPTAADLASGYHSDLGPCGQLAGWAQVGGQAIPQLVRNGEVENLPSLAVPSFVFATNSSNSVVGMFSAPTGGFAPFFIPENEGMIALPTLGGVNGQAYAINDATTRIVGATTLSSDSFVVFPTVWEIFGGPGGYEPVPQLLPVLSASGGSAAAVNNIGQVVGQCPDVAGQSRAIIWNPLLEGGYELLDLGSGVATDVNDHGVAVGSLDHVDGTSRGFVYEAGEIQIVRGPEPCLSCATRVVSVNESGAMVGSATFPGGESVALYWSAAEALPVVLSDRVEEFVAETYEITTAQRINDSGQILAAGYLGSEPLTFLLTPAGYVNPDTNLDQIPDACQPGFQPFTRGDINGDGAMNIADPIALLVALFSGETYPTCEDAADANDDSSLNIADSVFLLNHLFNNAPGVVQVGSCSGDPTPDSLECEYTTSCSAADVSSEESGTDQELCDGAVLLVEHAYSECIGGTWHVVTDSTYQCPDGTFVVIRTDDQDTGQPCP